jgi:hypothetical protein
VVEWATEKENKMNKQEQQIVDKITQGIGLWILFIIWGVAFILWLTAVIGGGALFAALITSTIVLAIAGNFQVTAEIDELRARNAAELNQPKENK